MVSIGPKIQITGESAYRQALNRIISETKELNSEMDLMVAKFSKTDSAIEKNKAKQEMLTRQIEQAKIQYDKFGEGLQKAVKKHEEANKQYAESVPKVEALRKKQEDLLTAMANLDKQGGKNTQAFKELEREYKQVTQDLKDAEKETQDYNKEVDRSGKVLADWQTATNKAEIELQNLKNQLRDLPSSIQLAGEAIARWGDAMEEVGSSMTMYLTTPLVAAGTAFVKWSSDFTDGMAKIYTIAEESEKPMAEMRQELINLSNQSGFSLDDLAEAEYQAVSASVATADSIKFLEQATKLARAGFTSTTKSVDILSTVMNSYGKETYDVAYISDILLKLQNDGKIVVDQMAEGMGTIIPLASAYNVGLEDLAAALATMTKQGVPASKAMTFLRAAFTELEKANSGVNKTLVTLTGHTFAQLMDSGMNLADVLGILYDHVKGDDEQFARLFGNVRSSQATISLATGGFSILRDEIEKMGHATGQTNYALEMLETPSLKAKRAIQQLKNSGMELGTTLINTLAPTFEKVVLAIKDITDAFSQMDEHQMKLILGFGAFLAAIGPMLTIFGKLNTAIGTFMAQLAAGTVPLTTTVGLITAGIAAFAGIATAAEVAAEQHRNEIAAVWGLDESMRNLIETSNQSAQAYDAQKEAVYGELNASLENVAVAQQLVDKYNELIDENGQVRAGHQELADVYFNQLAVALGMEQEDLRNLIEENGKFGESVQQTIEDIRQRAEAAAYEKILTDAIYRQTEAQMELEKQEGLLNAQQAKVTEATQQTQAAYEAMIEAQRSGNPEVGRYEQAWRDAVEAESQARASEAELQAAVNQTRGEVREAEADANAAANRIKTNAQSTMRDTANAISNGGSAVERSARNVSNRTGGALSVDGDGIGYQIDAGLAGGIDRYAYLVRRSAAQLAYEANHSLRGALSIESPSKVTAEAGKYFTEGFSIGIQDTMREAAQAAAMLAQSAVGGLQMVGYEPQPTNNYSKTVSAPISINLTIEGNVDGDDRAFAQNVADSLVNLINRKSEVFA